MNTTYRNALRTKRMIRAAYVELLGEKKRIDRITVSELSKRADIAKSTFYNHYSDVYAVLEEIEDELIGELSTVLDEIEHDHATEYERYVAEILRFLKEREALYRVLIGTTDTGRVLGKLKSVLSAKLAQKNDAFPFSEGAEKRQVQIRFVVNACVNTVTDWFRGDLSAPLEQVGEILLEGLNKLRQP